MLKTLFVSLTLATACTTSDKTVAPKGGNMSAPTPTEAKAGPAFATSKDGTKIAFERAGTGPALVIVGGALSQRSGGKPLSAKLEDQFTVYTYDRRGRGDSGDTKPYAVARELEDLGAIIERAGQGAYVYGVSSGAALALQAALQLGPSKVRKLAIYEPPYGQDEREFAAQKAGVEERVRNGRPGDAAEFFLAAIGMPPPALENMKRSPEWAAMQKIDFTLAYDYAVLGDGQVPASAKGVSVPTLVLTGEKSLGFIGPSADRIAELIPHAQRKTLKGQTHQAAPEVVAPLLAEFFEGARAQSAQALSAP